jgi:hypothetical protein
MKKLLLLSLILVFAVSSMSLAAVSKKKTTVKTTTKTTTTTTTKVQPAPAYVPVAKAPKSIVTVGPKLTMATGDFNGLSLGVESYFYEVPSVPGLLLGAEGNYKLQTNNISWIQIGGIGRYMIPMEGQAFMPYVGGGLNYNIYSIGVAGAGSASGIGFKIFGGADMPIAGVGILFGNIGYASNSFNYSVNIPGFGNFSVSANGSGLYLEGGYRIVI